MRTRRLPRGGRRRTWDENAQLSVQCATLSSPVDPRGSTAYLSERVTRTQVSDRCQLHRYIVYAQAVMVGPKAAVWVQMHFTHSAHKLCPPSPSAPLTAVHTVELVG